MKKVVEFICCFALVLGFSQGATAQDYRQRTDSALYAGFYLTIPLGPRTHTGSTRRLRYGFAAGPRFDLRGSGYDPTGRPALQARVIDLNFSGEGFERFTFAGTTLAARSRHAGLLSADEEGGDDDTAGGASDKKGRSVGGTILLVGVIVIGGVLALALVTACGDKVLDQDKDKFLDSSDFCPV